MARFRRPVLLKGSPEIRLKRHERLAAAWSSHDQLVPAPDFACHHGRLHGIKWRRFLERRCGTEVNGHLCIRPRPTDINIHFVFASRAHVRSDSPVAPKLKRMDITIGIRNVARELSVEVDGDTATLSTTISAAIKAGEPVTLTDTKGQMVIVPADALGYVLLGDTEARRVGFAL